MRDVTKSMVSFSWALTAFGTEQMVNLMMPMQGWRKSSGAMETVTRAVTAQLTAPTRSLFAAGDQVQRSMVDLFLGWSDAALGATNQAVRTGTSAVDQSAQAVRSATTQSEGWGPIPRA